MKDVTLKVEGMSCGHCVRAVEGALRGVPGVSVKRVEIGKAEVSVPDDSTMTAVVDALDEAGYSAEEALE